jgi:hypothetical protein
MAESGIAIILAAVASASCSYLSPGVLTVSFACIDGAMDGVLDDLAAASSRAHINNTRSFVWFDRPLHRSHFTVLPICNK